MIGAKSTCPRCHGRLLLTLTAAAAAELEYSEVTPDVIAKTILAGMVTERIACERCRRAHVN